MTQSWNEYLDALAVFGMKPGLERVESLLAALDEPQRRFRAVHVVGTNGKSSTTRYAAAIMTAHGLRAAAYLSPHLTGYPERVLVDGGPVGAEAFGRAVEAVREAAAGLPAEVGETTQFEVLTAAAFLAMAEAGVEVAAVEAGLGGRLDATNVLHAPVVVVTNIGLEHTDVLGATRELIFAEKAAVISAGADVVFGPLDGLEEQAAARCREMGAAAHHLGGEIRMAGGPHDLSVWVEGATGRGAEVAVYDGLTLPTVAGYQVANAALSVAACHFLLGRLRTQAVRRGLAATPVPGRLQIVRRDPLVIADGAHNPHGMAAMAASITAIERPRPRVALLAMMGDKAVDEMLALILPLVDAVVCVRASQPRSLSGERLAECVRAGGFAGIVAVSTGAADGYSTALGLAGDTGSVLVTGSLYLLEDLAAELAQA